MGTSVNRSHGQSVDVVQLCFTILLILSSTYRNNQRLYQECECNRRREVWRLLRLPRCPHCRRVRLRFEMGVWVWFAFVASPTFHNLNEDWVGSITVICTASRHLQIIDRDEGSAEVLPMSALWRFREMRLSQPRRCYQDGPGFFSIAVSHASAAGSKSRWSEDGS